MKVLFKCVTLLMLTLSHFYPEVNFRARFNIDGNMFADYVFSTLMWPQVIVQMTTEMDLNVGKEEINV